MRLLLDQNLSRNLVGRFGDLFPNSVHVTAVGMATATDAEIWDYAGAHGYAIVSKDSDFRQLAFLHGPPPKVVWLRLGNVNSSRVLQMLVEQRQAIEGFGSTEDEALLVLPYLPSA